MPPNSIRLARLAASLRQSEAARLVGRSQSWLSKVEAGAIVPTDEEVQRLSVIYGTDLSRVCVSRSWCRK
jgi:transcriptional regulator with XRE-family HTH domain